eukprot:scaffold47656_cov18-Prasinocladus_malaysianus.AAC.1
MFSQMKGWTYDKAAGYGVCRHLVLLGCHTVHVLPLGRASVVFAVHVGGLVVINLRHINLP